MCGKCKGTAPTGDDDQLQAPGHHPGRRAPRAAGLEAGEWLVARADGPGRVVVLEREHDVLGDFAGVHRRLQPWRTRRASLRVGLIHLDAGVVIGLLDADDVHHQPAAAAVQRAQRSGQRIAIASSAYAECLVAPSRRSDAAVRVVDDLMSRLPIDIIDLDVDIARAAARLRAHHRKLRLPDALVIATAVACSADELITTDRGWPSARAMRLDVGITPI